VDKKVVAVIGDSTFMHSGVTGLLDAVYNDAKITILILDNSTTAMTGHQEHPGTGMTVQGKKTQKVEIERLVMGAGVNNVKVVDAFDVKALRNAVRTSLDSGELSVVIVQGACAVKVPARSEPRMVDVTKCNQCGTCLLIGCSAVQMENGQVFIDNSLCMGKGCTVCQQICPKQAIGSESEIKAGETK
jgi:indolepyruvate ferredoxin oxidoreductase, alpha subunit